MSTAPHLAADERGVLVPCPQCHRVNRIPFARLHQTGQCGHCKTELPRPAVPVDVSSTPSFQALIQNASLPVFVDFWAPWCGPCLMVAPEIEKFAALAAGELLIAKVDTEAQPAIGSSMGIRSIPTFAVFRDGHEVGRTSGAMAADQLRSFALRAVEQAATR